MALYYDPTEGSASTRLPKAIIDSGISLPHLEEFTGADLLLSTIQTPRMTTLSESKPHMLALSKHLDHGILIQRKTTDLISSIPEMRRIVAKMLQYRPKFGLWLLFSGDVYEKDGIAYIDGQPVHGNYSLKTILMTFAKWQLRGGYVAQVKQDRYLPMWITGMLDLMVAIEAEPEIVVEPRKSVQMVISPNDETKKPWRTVLAEFPGIGPGKAKDIAEFCNTLGDSICFLSDPANHKLDDRPDGIGYNTLLGTHNYLGLKKDYIMEIMSYDENQLWHADRRARELLAEEQARQAPKTIETTDGEIVDVPW